MLENSRIASAQQADKWDHIKLTSLSPWPGTLGCPEGQHAEGTGGKAAKEHGAGIFIGPEFGTVSRADLASAVREAADGIAGWFVDTDYNEESFFVRQAYFLGAGDPYKSLKTTLKAEIDPSAGATLNSDTSRGFPKPSTGRIAVKVINHLGDEVMKVFGV